MKINKIIIDVFLLFVLLIITLQSCIKKDTQNLKIDSIAIPDSLYTFFPKNDSNSSLILKLYSEGTNARDDQRQGENNTFLESYFIKMYSCENVALFDSLIHEYMQEAIDSIKPINDNYFIIKYEDDMFKMYSPKILQEKYHESINKYILPSFHSDMRELYGLNYDAMTICGLPEDYKILIMKSGRNYVLPENRIWKVDWEILPPELKHGYTSGVAYRNVSDKIIYWCIAW